MVRRLSGTDSLFLAGETPAWHQHVGGLTIVDPSEAPGFGFDALCRTRRDAVAAVPEAHLEAQGGPAGARSGGVGRRSRRSTCAATSTGSRCAAPGGPRETAAAVAPIMSRQLDRRYPLWELWYLDGLVNGRVGVLMKFHHCLLDGGAGSVLASLLLGHVEPSPDADGHS